MQPSLAKYKTIVEIFNVCQNYVFKFLEKILKLIFHKKIQFFSS